MERKRGVGGTRGELRRGIRKVGQVLHIRLKTVEGFLPDGLLRTAKGDHVRIRSS